MSKDTLTAQELLNACVLKYSLSKIDCWNGYNFQSCLELYGYTVMVDDHDNFLIVDDFEYTPGDNKIACIGRSKYTTLEDAYKHLDYLQGKLSRLERNYKRYLEYKRLKKIKDDF